MFETEKVSLGLLRLILSVVSKGLTSTYAITKELNQFQEQTYDPSLIKRRITYASKCGYLTRYGDSKAPHYQLTENGLNKLNQLSLKLMTISTDQWDGKWRIVMFDIPEQNRPERDKIRNIIKDLGLRHLQHSAWITPYDCREQFEQIASTYGISNHLLLLEVSEFTQANYYKKYWNL